MKPASPLRSCLRSLLLIGWAGLVCMGSVPAARAHDKWLEVEPQSPAQPQPGKIYLVTGEPLQQAELLPERRRSRILRLELRSAQRRLDLLPAFREDSQPIAALPPLPLGSHLIALDSAPIDIELVPAKFSAYLLEERLIDILAERQRRGEEDHRGRERYCRHLKALVQVGDKIDALSTQPLGQELEIVPLVAPHTPGAAAELPVRVLFNGRPLAGRAVSAAQRWRGRVEESFRRTDSDGVARFPIERRGTVLFHLVHMQRAEAADAASGIDWRSHWASLTFTFPEPRAAD